MTKTFVDTEVLNAADLNNSFTEVEAAVNDNDTRISSISTPLLFASTELGSGTSVTATTSLEINSMAITIPEDGFITISGTAFINPVTLTAYRFRPLLNGLTVGASISFVAYKVPQNAADLFSFSYTITASITAGSHTLSQTIDTDASADYFYNRTYLTATFFPSSISSVSTSSNRPVIVEDYLNDAGEMIQ